MLFSFYPCDIIHIFYAPGQTLLLDQTIGVFTPISLMVVSPPSEQIAAEDPHVRVQQVWD